jgi:hypothetical protein
MDAANSIALVNRSFARTEFGFSTRKMRPAAKPGFELYKHAWVPIKNEWYVYIFIDLFMPVVAVGR